MCYRFKDTKGSFFGFRIQMFIGVLLKLCDSFQNTFLEFFTESLNNGKFMPAGSLLQVRNVFDLQFFKEKLHAFGAESLNLQQLEQAFREGFLKLFVVCRLAG